MHSERNASEIVDLISETIRSAGTIIVVTLTGAGIGLLFGCLLGDMVPDLFRAFFLTGRVVAQPGGGPPVTLEDSPRDPAQIAIGLGLINGAIMGFITQLVSVVASAWLRGRRIAVGRE